MSRSFSSVGPKQAAQPPYRCALRKQLSVYSKTRTLIVLSGLQFQPMAREVHLRSSWRCEARKVVEHLRGLHLRGSVARRGAEAVRVGTIERRLSGA